MGSQNSYLTSYPTYLYEQIICVLEKQESELPYTLSNEGGCTW